MSNEDSKFNMPEENLTPEEKEVVDDAVDLYLESNNPDNYLEIRNSLETESMRQDFDKTLSTAYSMRCGDDILRADGDLTKVDFETYASQVPQNLWPEFIDGLEVDIILAKDLKRRRDGN